jgi:hypothetical protein
MTLRCVCNHAKRTHSVDATGASPCRGKYCLCPRFDSGNGLESGAFQIGFEDLIRSGVIKKVTKTGTVKGQS